VVAASIPFVGALFQSMSTVLGSGPDLRAAPLLLPLLSAALGYLVFRTGFADIVPFAASETFHVMQDAVIVVGDDGIVLAANDAARESFPDVRVSHPIDTAAHALAKHVSDSSASSPFEMLASGRHWWGRLHPMRPTMGRELGTLVLLTDITDLKRKEYELADAHAELESRVRDRTRELEAANAELEQATKAKDRFLANVSHELRTPLSSVIAFCETLLLGTAGELNESQRERVEVILAAGKHQRAIIDDLLDLSRAKMGRAEIFATEFSLLDFTKLIANMARPLVEEAGLSFETDLPAQDATLETDQDKVRQILLNLLTNAAKFTESGSVALTVETPDAHRVAFRVRDTGPGIPQHELPDIMNEFVQVARDGSPVPGTGLGLAISRGLASLLGGDLRVESTIGEGSEFTLIIPTHYAPGRISA
jgi:signal transduction histidine kinase